MSKDAEGDVVREIVPIFNDMLSKAKWEAVAEDLTRSYYVCLSWDVRLYANLCYRGFVSVAQENWLIPELQRAYAVLDYSDIHVERNVKKRVRQRRYVLRVDHRPEEVFVRICEHHPNNWLGLRYWKMLKDASGGVAVPLADGYRRGVGETVFVPRTFALVDLDTGALVAGEIGYTVGQTYTSLTGFCDHSYPSAGKVQVLAMARFLQERGVAVINLGHTPRGEVMKYKTDIGARTLLRKDFLARWHKHHHGFVVLAGEAAVTPEYLVADRTPPPLPAPS